MQGHCLAERKLGIASTGRKIDEEKIKIGPIHLMNELIHSLLDHGTTPNDRLIIVDEKSNTHQPHTMGYGRNDPSVGVNSRAFIQSHHQRNARPINIAVEQPHCCTTSLERAGEVDRA